MIQLKTSKNELRRLIRLQKRQLLPETRDILSINALSTLENLPAFREATIVVLYHSLDDEVDTHEFIRKWSPSKHILLPVIRGENLELCLYKDIHHLQTGSFGVQEPIGEVFTDYSAIDCAVIPGMAFDKRGNRLGRGKGYYDRLLSHLPAFKIGICFPFQLIEEVPTNEWDIRMDLVITGINEKRCD